MAPKRIRADTVRETLTDDVVVNFFRERAQHAGCEPLTAEEFMRLAGELEAAQRLARLKRELSPEVDHDE